MEGSPKLPFCFHLCLCNAIQSSRAEQRAELGPWCPIQEEEDSQVICQYDISYPQAYGYCSDCNSKQIRTWRDYFWVYACLMPEITLQKVIYLPLEINSGWIMNQIYWALDAGFWYTIILQLSSMKFIGIKKIISDQQNNPELKPCSRVFVFRKRTFSQVSEQMQCSDIFLI